MATIRPPKMRPGRLLPYARAVRKLRHQLALTGQEFAVFVGCNTKSLSAWENGETRPGRLAQAALKHVAHDAGYMLDLEAGTVQRRQRSA